MVLIHVATGAAGGFVARKRLAAVPMGLVLHAAADVVPHDDVPSHAFEAASGVAALAWLGRRFGAFDPVTVGAAVSAAPDLEHVLRLPRPGGRKIFPTHRWPRPAGRRRVPVAAQVLGSAAILVLLARRHAGPASSPRCAASMGRTGRRSFRSGRRAAS